MMKKRKIGVVVPYNIKDTSSCVALGTSIEAASQDEGVKPTPTHQKSNYDPFSRKYDMRGDKFLYIFNHDTWTKTTFYGKIPPERPGTERDVTRLQKSFGAINFIVDEPCNNFTYRQIEDKIENICSMHHKNTSCVAIAVLTHGDGDRVCAADKAYMLSDITTRLLLEPKLAGIPKLFFVQACRGDKINFGHRYQLDLYSRVKAITIPTHSDSLVLMSTYNEFVSLRDSKDGSWMIQALCDVLDECHKNEDLLTMMMLVNNKVALKNYNTSKPANGEIKQIPEIQFTLTKALNF